MVKFDLDAIDSGSNRGNSERMNDIITASLKFPQYSGPKIAAGLHLKANSYVPTSVIRQTIVVAEQLGEDFVVNNVKYRVVKVVPATLVKNEPAKVA